APVESLMPLRLAKYGVPLAETAPAGLAAAGIEPVLLPTAPQHVVAERLEASPVLPAQREHAPDMTVQDAEHAHPADPSPWFTTARTHHGTFGSAGEPQSSAPQEPGHSERPEAGVAEEVPPGPEGDGGASAADLGQAAVEEPYFQAFRQYADEYGGIPGGDELARYVLTLFGQHGPVTGLLSAETLNDLVVRFHARYVAEIRGISDPPAAVPNPRTATEKPSTGAEPRAADEPLPAAVPSSPEPEPRREPVPPHVPPEQPSELTTVDRYYLAWDNYRQRQGREPDGDELSQFLAMHRITGRGGKPAKASNLRRHLLEFRVYALWAAHRAEAADPRADILVKELAEQGIRAQYGHPINVDFVEKWLPDFERRWAILSAARVGAPARTRQRPPGSPDVGHNGPSGALG
ncbi:hypothetical protein ACH4YL_39450, partial [Streptomyces sp. NPDC020681]